MFKLRDCQQFAVDAIEKHVHDDPVAWMVMGSGKSVTIAELAARIAPHHNVIVTVPTQELVRQISETIQAHTGHLVGQWYADRKQVRPITVACHQSLHTLPKDLRPDDPFASERGTVWIADECHKTECETVKSWAEKTQPLHRIGFTATPYRSSEKQAVSLFKKVVYEYLAADAYRDGHVVKPTLVHAPEGDLNDVCLEFITAQDVPGVCNAVTVEDAEYFASELRKRGIESFAVHYQSDKTASDARAFLSANAGCVVYVDMLSEGFDCPPIQYMAMRRMVGSRVRFAQEVGRGLRASPNKTTCHLFDPHDLFLVHDLSFEACLGEIDVDEPIPTLRLQMELELGMARAAKEGTDIWGTGMPAKALSAARSYLRQAALDLKMRKVVEEKVEAGTWRSKPVSHKQKDFVNLLFDSINGDAVPEPHRTCLLACYHAMWTPQFKKGDITDLITILKNWRQLC
jgi:superfamily II DNA/RNA helicase